jgi:hypothetical protein
MVQKAMRECAIAHSWAENLSVAQWLTCWEQHYGTADNLRLQLQAIERIRFAK